MHLYARYIRTLLLTAVAVLFFVAGFTLTIDPYGYFGTPRITGLSRIKPASATRNRTVKPIAMARINPRTLILGNSRPEVGLDPASPIWPKAKRPIYNFGIPGAGVSEQGRYGLLALSKQSLRFVYWGVDFVDFMADRRSMKYCNRSSATVKVVVPKSSTWKRLKDTTLALWSLRAVLDSVWTVLSQYRPYSANRTMLGFNPARDYWPTIVAEGQGVLFKEKNAEVRKRLFGQGLMLVGKGCNWSSDFEALNEVLEAFKAKGIHVVLFINPYHVDYLNIIREAGLWQQFQTWKNYLAEIARETGSELWDFSKLDPRKQENVETLRRGQALQWFWEPAHYRRALGRLMLSQMLDGFDSIDVPVGVRLVP